MLTTTTNRASKIQTTGSLTASTASQPKSSETSITASRPRAAAVNISSEARERDAETSSSFGSLLSGLQAWGTVDTDSSAASGRANAASGRANADTNLSIPGQDAVTRFGGQVVRNGSALLGSALDLMGANESAESVRQAGEEMGGVLDPRPRAEAPAGPNPEAQARRANGVPQELDNHFAGPPATPSAAGDIANDIDPATGQPRTGTLFNNVDGQGHRYATRNSLPDGLTREQAEQVFRRFYAPTTEALNGEGNDPNARGGSVDPRGVLGDFERSLPPALRSALELSGDLGGDVDFNRGSTEDGRPWAINSTVPGRHPLVGHITRTLEEHEGRYYIRTEGVGSGDDYAWGTRHQLNALVGPRTFNNLDSVAVEYARRISSQGLGAPQ